MEQNNNQSSNGQPRKSNNKNLIIAGIAIIVVIALAIAIPHLKQGGTTTPVDTTAVANDTNNASSSNGSAVASMAAWNSLFEKYDGKIIVFGADCNTTPHLLQHQAKGTTVLLMNNSNVAHVITAAGSTYNIGAYHYKTIVLNQSSAVVLGCDGHADVAAITIQ